jgi:hypothetical protein
VNNYLGSFKRLLRLDKIRNRKISRRMKTETKISLAALIVAIVSMLLSQFPPLHTYLQEPKIEIIPAKEISITHQWGHLQLVHYIQARNVGDRTGEIYKIGYFMKSEDSKYRQRFEANFIGMMPGSGGMSSPTVPFGTITLRPNEVWDNVVISFTPASLADQPKAMELAYKINAWSQRQPAGSTDGKPQSSQASQTEDGSIQEARRLVEENLQSFAPGKYRILMMVWFDESPNPSINKLYEFTILEHHMLTLKSVFDDMIELIKQGPTYIPKKPVYANVAITEIKEANRISKTYEDYLSQEAIP